MRPATPLLLLDEATSALDASLETRVLDALLATPGRTTLVVAHRLRAIAPAADHVVVFRAGRVVAEGTHDALLAESADYQELWRANATKTKRAS